MHKNFVLYALAAAAVPPSQVVLARVNVDTGIGVPVAPVYTEPAPVYAPPPPPAYHVPASVYVASQPVIVAPGYYDNGRGREWRERQWRERRWRERE